MMDQMDYTEERFAAENRAELEHWFDEQQAVLAEEAYWERRLAEREQEAADEAA